MSRLHAFECVEVGLGQARHDVIRTQARTDVRASELDRCTLSVRTIDEAASSLCTDSLQDLFICIITCTPHTTPTLRCTHLIQYISKLVVAQAPTGCTSTACLYR
jgi:hypothetical protein